MISERYFLCVSALINAAPITSGKELKLKFISAHFCVLGLQFKSSFILESLGRGRWWCMDIYNTLDDKLKRKMLFLNAKGKNNT